MQNLAVGLAQHLSRMTIPRLGIIDFVEIFLISFFDE